MSAQRIQRKRTKGWRAPAGAVCVTRPSIFGNPFTVKMAEEANHDNPREAAIRFFRYWLEGDKSFADYRPEHRAELLRRLSELKGKTLMCYCRPDQSCHADVLIELANEVPDA